MVCGKIIEIYADGYERTAVLDCGGNIINVHFLEPGEYVAAGRSLKRQIGDELKGRLYIDKVCTDRPTEENLSHCQPFKMSVHIKAAVEVTGIIDGFSVNARTSVDQDVIQIEFEHSVTYKAGNKVYIEGSLEIGPLP